MQYEFPLILTKANAVVFQVSLYLFNTKARGSNYSDHVKNILLDLLRTTEEIRNIHVER